MTKERNKSILTKSPFGEPVPNLPRRQAGLFRKDVRRTGEELRISIFIIFVLCSFLTNAQTKNCFINANPTEFQINIDSLINEVILDVRPFEDLKNKAIPDAVFAPSKDDLNKMTDTLDTETPILVYCVVGIRSEKVCEMLCEKGFTNVTNLKGGFDKWKKQDFETAEYKKE